MMTQYSQYVIGDVHGHRDKLLQLLGISGLVRPDRSWSGGTATLWLLGDYCDRGPDGIGVIELIIKLQRQAGTVGGRVEALLGNHEVLLLAAHHFGDRPTGGPGGTFRSDWEVNGGLPADLERLTPELVGWLTVLPAMVQDHDLLLLHADALLYTRYGLTCGAVNSAVRAILQGRDPGLWDRLLDEFSERQAFDHSRPGGTARAAAMLRRYGGQRLLHGHTPVSLMCSIPPEMATEAFVYADGRCVNVDSGMYLGGPGFIYEVSAGAGEFPEDRPSAAENQLESRHV